MKQTINKAFNTPHFLIAKPLQKKLKLTSSTKGAIISITISVIILLLFYHANIFSPNKFIFSSNNDGLKTYFNFAWHGYHDKSLHELNAMSYPYGEFLLFEDSLPFFSSINMLLIKVFPSFSNYSVGILNMLVFLSFIVAVLFMYLIFKHFSLPYYLSSLTANAIVFLSSQVLLLNPAGHFGLSFVCFFPIGWYLILKYFDDTKPIKWSVLIALNILLWTFTHVYLGFTLIFFTAGVHFFKFIFNKNIRLSISKTLHIAIQLILPVTTVFILYTFDNHPDRIDMPFTTAYAASFQSVFLSLLSPFKFIYSALFDINIVQSQSWGKIGNYIGLASNIAIILFVFISIYLLVKKKVEKVINFLPQQLYIYLIASILLLLYSMAIPVKYMPYSIIEMVPLLKQFSALGRFAWGFYYVIAVFTFVFFYRWFYTYKWGKFVFYMVIILFFVESIPSHLRVSKAINITKNSFNSHYIPNSYKILTNIDKNKFQAIMPLPYYFKFNLPFGHISSDSSIYASMVASYYSGLPIASTYLSRPSVSESLNIYKMFLPWPYKKEIPEIINAKKDIAVIVHHSDTALLNQNEKIILSKAKPYLSSSSCSIYSLQLNDLFKPNNNKQLNEFYKVETQLLNKNGCLVKDTSNFVLYNNFDESVSDITYFGKGALKGKKLDYTHLCKIPTAKLDTSIEYEVSFWYYNYVWDQTFNTAIITEIDSAGKTLQYLYYSPLKNSIVDGWWYLSKHTFKPILKNSNIIIMMHGNRKFEDWFVVDELLIRPTFTDVYMVRENKGQSTIYCNNKRLNRYIMK